MTNILIVEDDAFFRGMCVRHLTREGRVIRTATDGAEGMRELEKEQPDLLILDILMPGTDGFAVLDFRKAKGWTFPVILLSNMPWNFSNKDYRKLGASECFIKSNIDITELAKKAEEYLSGLGK